MEDVQGYTKAQREEGERIFDELRKGVSPELRNLAVAELEELLDSKHFT